MTSRRGAVRAMAGFIAVFCVGLVILVLYLATVWPFQQGQPWGLTVGVTLAILGLAGIVLLLKPVLAQRPNDPD